MELVEISRELASQVSLRPLLQKILSKASELTDSPDSSVLLYDNKRRSLYFAAATGSNSEMCLENWGESSDQRIPLKGSIAGEVFLTGVTRVTDAAEED